MRFGDRTNTAPIRWGHFAVALALVSCLDGQPSEGPAKRKLVRERDVEVGRTWGYFPVWGGGRLAWYERSPSDGPRINIADYSQGSNGRLDQILFTIPESSYIQMREIAVSSSGEIAAIGAAITPDGRWTSFLARISADRQHQTLTRLFPYSPFAVVFAPDGSAWTIGLLKSPDGEHDVGFHILRRFDPFGKLLGSREIVLRGDVTLESVSFFRASHDRVSLFTADGEYIEFALDGSEIGRYEGPDGASVGKDTSTFWSMAISADNRVIVGVFGRGRSEFYLLDRQQSHWVPLEIAKEQRPVYARLLGFEDGLLVTTTSVGRLSHFKPN